MRKAENLTLKEKLRKKVQLNFKRNQMQYELNGLVDAMLDEISLINPMREDLLALHHQKSARTAP